MPKDAEKWYAVVQDGVLSSFFGKKYAKLKDARADAEAFARKSGITHFVVKVVGTCSVGPRPVTWEGGEE
ncbi:MAG TPA: hypothetical protein PLZ78_09060 [Spirochaetota bacterium]|nr:hypothetical protein [Spirochaetota bacterium]